MISGRDQRNQVLFSETYPLSELWRYVPLSLRGFWIDSYTELGGIDDRDSFFVDRTNEMSAFWKHISRFNFKDMLMAIDPNRVDKNWMNVI